MFSYIIPVNPFLISIVCIILSSFTIVSFMSEKIKIQMDKLRGVWLTTHSKNGHKTKLHF